MWRVNRCEVCFNQLWIILNAIGCDIVQFVIFIMEFGRLLLFTSPYWRVRVESQVIFGRVRVGSGVRVCATQVRVADSSPHLRSTPVASTVTQSQSNTAPLGCGRFTALMCSRQICGNCVMLSCQNGPESQSTLLNPCHRAFLHFIIYFVHLNEG